MTMDTNVLNPSLARSYTMFKNITTISNSLTAVITSAASTLEVGVSSINDLANAGKKQTEMVLLISEHDVTKKKAQLDKEITDFKASLEPKALPESKK